MRDFSIDLIWTKLQIAITGLGGQELMEQQKQMKGENDDDPNDNKGNGGTDGNPVEAREQSGTSD